LAILELGTNGIIIRTSWLYSLDKANFVTAILKKARATGILSVVFDQLGTPTYTYDLGLAILDIIKNNFDYINNGMNIYHYSNEGAISWYDFAVNCCRIAGVNAAITPVFSTEYPTKVERPFHAIMSKAKIRNDFNLSIPYWRDSLEKCLADKNKLEKI
jgi:dTDP-4-dehydrorhamnose reductase